MPRPGFTLLELLLVLALLGVAGALVAGRLGPLREGAALDAAAGRLRDQARRSQDLAAGTGWPVRLRIDLSAGAATAAVLGAAGPADPADGAAPGCVLVDPPLAAALRFAGEDRVEVAAGTVDVVFAPDRRCDRPGMVTIAIGGGARSVRWRAAATPPEVGTP